MVKRVVGRIACCHRSEGWQQAKDQRSARLWPDSPDVKHH